MSETILEIKDLKKSFGDTPILQGLSLKVQKGEVVVILGPSGKRLGWSSKVMNSSPI